VWQGLEQSLIDDAVDYWPMCFRASVHAIDGHFEHLFMYVWLQQCKNFKNITSFSGSYDHKCAATFL